MRKNQVLLSFLKVRVIVDNKEIYPLLSSKPVVIEVKGPHPKIVVTDGFHYTRPLQFDYKVPSYYKVNVVCAIDDLQLLGGLFCLVFFYLLGFYTGIFIIKLLSFLPILFFLFLYYINRGQFLQLRSG